MNNNIPEEIRETVNEFVDLLKKKPLFSVVEGIYVYGSVALGFFNEKRSDIDIIVFLKRPVTNNELSSIRNIHRHMKNVPYGKRLEVMYLQWSDFGKENDEMIPYPYCNAGKVKIGYWDVNVVTWWLIGQCGITLYGPQEVPVLHSFKDLKENMNANLNQYWPEKLAESFSFYTDEDVEFSVSTVSRIICTLEDKKILPKEYAMEKVLFIVPKEYHAIIEEGLRLRYEPDTDSKYTSLHKRAVSCRKFVTFAIDYCNEKYFSKQSV